MNFLEHRDIEIAELLTDHRPSPHRDFEYASNNDRLYDFAIWSGEMFFPDAVDREIIDESCGRYDRSAHARLIVHRALADLKWSTWAMVQNRTSTLDFDFYKYGIWKHMHAHSIICDPQLASLPERTSMTPLDHDIDAFLAFAGELADLARPIALSYFRVLLEVITKGDESPVTIAERTIDATLRSTIYSRFRDHGIFVEEMGIKKTGSLYTW